MSLTAQQRHALRELSDLWPDKELVIIGATALGFYYDMRWRQTADVDLVIALELEDFPGALREREGWTQHPDKQHELISPRGAKIDLLPAGNRLLQAGRLTWPSGHVMSLTGMDLAFQHADSHRVEDETVLVAPPPVVTILKMASYCDRPAERERDLEDIAHLLYGYVDDLSERRWDEAAGQDYELAPAYLLGLDVGRAAQSEAHRKLVDAFLARVLDPASVGYALMYRRGPGRWRDEELLASCLDAFRAGYSADAPWSYR